MNYIYLVISGLFVASMSFIGLTLNLTPNLRKTFEQRIDIMKSFSAGIFLSTTFFLIKKASEILSFPQLGISILLGFSIYFLIHALVCSKHHLDEQAKKEKASQKVLIGDAFHNIADGIVLVASFTLGKVFGIGALISMLIHEMPQEFSKFIILREAGSTPFQASWKSFRVALTIFIGIVIGLFLTHAEIVRGFFLGATASFFLGVVFHDLFPLDMFSRWKREKKLISHIFSLIIGIVIMLIAAFILHHHH